MVRETLDQPLVLALRLDCRGAAIVGNRQKRAPSARLSIRAREGSNSSHFRNGANTKMHCLPRLAPRDIPVDRTQLTSNMRIVWTGRAYRFGRYGGGWYAASWSISFATSPVQPVWCEGPTPSPE